MMWVRAKSISGQHIGWRIYMGGDDWSHGCTVNSVTHYTSGSVLVEYKRAGSTRRETMMLPPHQILKMDYPE